MANGMNFLNYGQAVTAGQQIQANRQRLGQSAELHDLDMEGGRIRNELAGIQLSEARNIIKNRAKAQEIRTQIAQMPDQIQALRAQGLNDEADQVFNAYIAMKTNGINLAIAQRDEVNAENWDQYREDMIQSGAMDDHMMPVEYDENWFRDLIEKEKGDIKVVTQRSTVNDRTMAQDIRFQDGSVLEVGEWYEEAGARNARVSEQRGGDDGEIYAMNASDSSEIRRSVGALWGTMWDPQTEQYIGLNRQQQQEALSVTEEAAKIYNQAQGRIPHAEAAARAARAAGIPGIEEQSGPTAVGGDVLNWRQPNVSTPNL